MADAPEERRPRSSYRRPPIVEALCTLRFASAFEWDPTVPGRLYERLASDYPELPKQEELVAPDFSAKSDSEGPGVTLRKPSSRITFRNQNKLVTVRENAIGIHCLAPYEGWPSLRKRVEDALAAYEEVASPKGVEELTVRYVNRVDIPGRDLDFTDYFTIGQSLPPAFPAILTGFFDRVNMRYEDIPADINFTWTSLVDSPSEDIMSFILDFDLLYREGCAISDALKTLDELHDREKNAFESVIKQPLREVFDAD